MAEHWLAVKGTEIFPRSTFDGPWAWLQKRAAVHANTGVRAIIEAGLRHENLEDALVPVEVVATSLTDGHEVWLTHGPAVEAILASTAIPSIFPPVAVDGDVLVDGGVVNNVPISRALAAGCDRIYVLLCGPLHYRPLAPRRPVEALLASFFVAIHARFMRELAALPPGVEVIVFSGGGEPSGQYRDFSATATLIEEGRAEVAARPRPLRRDLQGGRRVAPAHGAGGTGARHHGRGGVKEACADEFGTVDGLGVNEVGVDEVAVSHVGGPGDGYLLANAAPGAAERLAAIATLFDPATFGHFDRLGLAPGWRCWEVGAGGHQRGATIWPDRVGPDGHVLATDIDVSWAPSTPAGTVEVRAHDVADGPPPGAPFDLVHARLVLVHVPGARPGAGHHGRACCGPGGVLLVEDADPALQPLACLEETGPAEELANRVRRGFRVLLAERGADLAYGRTLPRRLREAGLAEVGAEAAFPVGHPACDVSRWPRCPCWGTRLVEHGVRWARRRSRQHLANVRGGGLDLVQPPMVSRLGPSPAAPERGRASGGRHSILVE